MIYTCKIILHTKFDGYLEIYHCKSSVFKVLNIIRSVANYLLTCTPVVGLLYLLLFIFFLKYFFPGTEDHSRRLFTAITILSYISLGLKQFCR